MVAIASTLAGVALTAATILVMTRWQTLPRTPAFTYDAGDLTWVAAAIGRSQLKIALFAVTLAAFLLVIEYWPITDSTRGILAGLPVVPFGGLVSVAGDFTLSADSRVATFLGMIGSAWLAPAIAVWFIFCLSRFLGARRRLGTPTADSLSRFGAILAGWLFTFAVIIAMATAINAVSGHQYPSIIRGGTS
jgi:hypothetical protein